MTSTAVVAQTVGQVIRPVLVLLVCLALPVNAATAVYQHLHTESAHSDDHHDGREVHRHAATAAAHEHAHSSDSEPAKLPDSQQTDTDIVAVAAGAWRPALTAATDTIVETGKVPTLPLAKSATSIAPAFVALGDVRTSHESLPDDPTTTASALRGPPR